MILFKNKNWTIEKINNKELKISNGWENCYCYLNERDYLTKQLDIEKTGVTNDFILSFDYIICPPYIQKIALKKAIKHIEILTN